MRCSPRSCRVLLALLGVLIAPSRAHAGNGWHWFGFHDDQHAAQTAPSVEGQPLVHEVTPNSDRSNVDHGPGALSRMGQGTSRAFAKMRSAVRLPASDAEPRVVSEYSHQGSATTSPKKRRTWFSSWFRSSEPKRPQTAQDFIGLPRPGI